MQYAAAMKYGGELVEAVKCDYDSFKQLVPLCPECKEPVYLRAGCDRKSSKGKEYKIPKHWSHFAGKTPEQVAACENRVNGYTEKDKQRIAAQARGQRLKLLQRWFWAVWTRRLNEVQWGQIWSGDLVFDFSEVEDSYSDYELASIKQEEEQQFSAFIDVFTPRALTIKTWLDDWESAREKKEECSEFMWDDSEAVTALDGLISFEVFQFLTSKRNRYSLLKEVWHSAYSALWDFWRMADGGEGDFEEPTADEISHRVLRLLMNTPWVTEFQRLEQEPKAA